MATIKAYTDLSQSKTLSKILPLESADYHYIAQGEKSYFYSYSLSSDAVNDYDEEIKYIPCWSLAALLGVLPNGIVMNKDSQNGRYHFSSKYVGTYVTADNPIDACYEMIIKLHELNLL